ncbi:hypothetical protein GCM10023169_24970 [Georgenia halophila]|uniref:HTH cro/C1-type domain-containing protein n=1 Tax=Georgenia halophila TaxID=620889 RepID=A0ABP8LCD0_9MICO
MGEIRRIGDVRRRAARKAEPLWRELLGEKLRDLRLAQGRTLTETAEDAGMSPQYLSEVERGRKEPSSEMIAAVARALGTTLLDLTDHVSVELRSQQAPAMRAPAPPQRAGNGQASVQLSLAA